MVPNVLGHPVGKGTIITAINATNNATIIIINACKASLNAALFSQTACYLRFCFQLLRPQRQCLEVGQ